MLYLIFATALTVLAVVWARSANTSTLATFHQLGNAAGILTRILTVFDSIRQVAEWFKDGAKGAGPLSVPVPARAAAPTAGTGPFSVNTPRPSKSEYGIDDIPPRMTAPVAVIN